jgi:hypothetical protein
MIKGGRLIFVFCLFVFVTFQCFAQEEAQLYIKFLKNLNTGKISLDNRISSFIEPPYLYYFTKEEWNTDERILKIYSLNTVTNIKDSLEINVPKKIIINELPEVAISNNFIILCDDEYFTFYLFEKKNVNFIYSNQIKLPSNSSGREMSVIDNDKFLIYTMYNFHPDAQTFNSNIGIYDAKHNKFTNFIHPDLPCIGFSHLPKSWVTFNDKLIAIADPCGYKIRMYDFNLKLVDSIDFIPTDHWNNLAENKIPVETDPQKINPKLLIDQLLLLQDTISRIEKIYFINNTKLLVSSTCKKCGKEKRRIDVWETNRWSKPVYTNHIFPVSYVESDTINMDNLPLPYYHLSNVHFENNLMYSVIDENYYSSQNIPVKQFNTLKDLYYEKNDPEFSIGIYRINFH